MWVLSAVAVVLGLVGGLAAVVLFKMISLMTHLTLLGDVGFDLPTLRGYHPTLWLIPITVGGGLLVSVFATWSPVIRGHGIPESLEAILDRDSRIKPRAAIAKPLSAAITIGTGGPFGAEGPIIVTGGSIGSLIGQMLSVSAAERKIMLATGAAAGMSATFNTPVAAVILAIELVLFERSLRVIVPLTIASGIAAAIHVVAFGGQPLFAIQAVLHVSLAHLPLFVLVGAASGLMAIVLNKGLFAMEAAFRRLPINIFWWPAIGALGFALIGLAAPRTLSMGYSAIIDTLNGHFTTVALAVLLVAKLLSWLIALGSQTSGGTLAPMFLVGATMGALLGAGVNAIFPAWHVSPAAFALVAMGATFGAATKALFAAVVFAAEVTGEYTMFVPLFIGAAVAELVVEGVLSDRLMTEKLSHRGFRVEFRTAVDTLRTRVARQIMRDAVWVPIDASPARAADVMSAHGLTELAVVGTDGRYLGIVTAAALEGSTAAAGAMPGGDPAAPAAGAWAASGLADLVTPADPVAPDDYLAAALEGMLARRVDALPVVRDGIVVGLIGRDDIDAERYRRGAAQEIRQAGWLASVPWPWRRRADGAGAVPTGLSQKIVIPQANPTLARADEPPAAALASSVHSVPERPGSDRPAPGQADSERPTLEQAGAAQAVSEQAALEQAGAAQAAPEPPPAAAAERHAVTPAPHAHGSHAKRPAHDRLLPDPVQLTPGLGQFTLSEKSRIVVAWGSSEAIPVAERLAEELRRATGLRLRVSQGRAYRDDISLQLGLPAGLPAGQHAEGYVLTAGVTGVTAVAATLTGLHHAAQTVRQLLPVWASAPQPARGPWTIPAAAIVDYPRRSRRALALDLSTGLLSTRAVGAIVDRISAYKMNRLILVLSEEHRERLAAAGVDPALADRWQVAAPGEAGGQSARGYWTALEYQQLVAYAEARFVTLDIVGEAPDDATAVALSGPEVTLTTVIDAVAALPGGDAVTGRASGHEHAGLTAVQGAVFPQILAIAEAGWSPRATFAGGPAARADFLARLATQAPRLALHDTVFTADPAVPWRLHMMTLPSALHRRTFDGAFALLIAPGQAEVDLSATIDWGDGTASTGSVVADDTAPTGCFRYRILARHDYARPGSFRAAITVTAPDVVAARASMVLRAGSTGALRRRPNGPGGAAGLPAGAGTPRRGASAGRAAAASPTS